MKRRLRTYLACIVIAFAGPVNVHAATAGDVAPSFSLPDGAGKTVTLQDFRGQVVYVDFWASWCGPCRRSFPWLNEMQQKYGARGLTVIGINVDKRRVDADRFLRDVPARFAIAFDERGVTPAAFAVKGMPSSYLIDAEGRIAVVEEGFFDDRKVALEERIRALLPAR